MALGQRVAVWAAENGVPRRTCYDWRKTDEYKRTVEDIRRRSLERAMGHLVRNLAEATTKIVHLAAEGESQTLQLQAFRMVLREFMHVRERIEWDYRMTDIERRLDQRGKPSGPARHAAWTLPQN
jgi:hypothetical protein